MKAAVTNVIVPCVDYSDFLHHTLPQLQLTFSEITVVTSHEDDATQRLCADQNVNCLKTDAWYLGHDTFNKARALNKAIERVDISHPNSWVLILDADIFVPNGFELDINSLDPQKLYSSKRRICETEDDWKEYKRGVKTLTDFSVYEIPITNGKAWGHRPTKNPAGLAGYFQLWNPIESGICRFPLKPTASCYDVEFALNFPENRREWLLDKDVMHLGPLKTNWAGRRSQLWGSSDATNELPSRGRFIVRQLEHLSLKKGIIGWKRINNTNNAVFVQHSPNHECYLKLFEERDRIRVQREETGISHFTQIVNVPNILASSMDGKYSGAPFLLTEAIAPEFFAINGNIDKLGICKAISDHYEKRLTMTTSKSLTMLFEKESYGEMLQKKINRVEEINKSYTEYGGDIAAAGDMLMKFLLVALQGIPRSRSLTIQHGDFNGRNVFCDKHRNLALIDFEEVCMDDEAADLFNLCNWLLDESEANTQVVRDLLDNTSMKLKPGFTQTWKAWSIFRWFTDGAMSLKKVRGAQKREITEVLIKRASRLATQLGAKTARRN